MPDILLHCGKDIIDIGSRSFFVMVIRYECAAKHITGSQTMLFNAIFTTALTDENTRFTEEELIPLSNR